MLQINKDASILNGNSQYVYGQVLAFLLEW